MSNDLLTRVKNIRQFSHVTPHKPLLLLWAVGNCLKKDEDRLVPYRIIKKELSDLHERLGFTNKNFRPYLPFWRLVSDKVWIVENAVSVRTTKSGDAFEKDLLNYDIHGGLLEEDYRQLRNDSELATEVVLILLEKIGPETRHEEILDKVGIYDEYITVTRKKRRSKFREIILQAYDSKCAICELSLKAHQKTLGVEAAHIKWHGYGGPDRVTNGIALCSVHHVLFDRGAFTLDLESPESKNYQVVIASSVSGSGHGEWLARYDRQSVRKLPQDFRKHPAKKFLKWHQKIAFLSREIPLNINKRHH